MSRTACSSNDSLWSRSVIESSKCLDQIAAAAAAVGIASSLFQTHFTKNLKNILYSRHWNAGRVSSQVFDLDFKIVYIKVKIFNYKEI